MTRPAMSLPVVGADHPNKDGGNRRSEIAFCNRGEPVELRPDPKNEFDENAVAVYSARGFQIGYISSARAVLLTKLLREGHELHAVFQDIAPWGAIARVGVDQMPTLPEEGATADEEPEEEVDPDQDFWPDYIPPDD